MFADYQLVALTPHRGDRLRALMQRIYPPAYGHYWSDNGAWYLDSQYNQATLERELEEPGAHYYLIERAGSAVGNLRVVYGRPSPERPGRPGTYLHRLYLGASAQGTGLAAALLGEILTAARAAGDTYVWLQAMEQQPQARRFYEKHDFQPGRAYELDFTRMHPAYRGIRYYHRELVDRPQSTDYSP